MTNTDLEEIWTERSHALTEQLAILFKRLNHFEEEKARTGLSAKFEVKDEIEYLRNEVNKVYAELEDILTKLSSLRPLHLPAAREAIIEVKFKGDWDSVPEDRKEVAIKAIRGVFAGIVDCLPEKVIVDSVIKGSIIMRMRIPADKVETLLRKHREKDPILEILGIEAIKITDLRGADLHGADLSVIIQHGDLHGANLYGADLSETDLSETDLSETDLSEANLSGSSLAGANLTGANLTRANLRKANLSGADLAGTILYRTDLSGADLRHVDLRGTDLTTVFYDETTIWPFDYDISKWRVGAP